MIRPITFVALLLVLAPATAATQAGDTTDASRAGWSVDRTMREFVQDVGGPVRGYFPRRGDWTWVMTVHGREGRDHREIWRFPAAQSDSALAYTGPVCDSFSSGDYALGGTVVQHAHEGRGRNWRRVGATRFVPPGRPAAFPVFVEWWREDGRWVISSFGGERYYAPRVLGRSPREAVRGPRPVPLRLPLPDSAQVAAGAEWFVSNEPIPLAGRRLTRYGLPRQLRESDLQRWGVLRGVGIYVEAGTDARIPDVVYIPVDRTGSFQPYQNMMGNGCQP
jgi:hypothetical protein